MVVDYSPFPATNSSSLLLWLLGNITGTHCQKVERKALSPLPKILWLWISAHSYIQLGDYWNARRCSTGFLESASGIPLYKFSLRILLPKFFIVSCSGNKRFNRKNQFTSKMASWNNGSIKCGKYIQILREIKCPTRTRGASQQLTRLMPCESTLGIMVQRTSHSITQAPFSPEALHTWATVFPPSGSAKMAGL